MILPPYNRVMVYADLKAVLSDNAKTPVEKKFEKF